MTRFALFLEAYEGEEDRYYFINAYESDADLYELTRILWELEDQLSSARSGFFLASVDQLAADQVHYWRYDFDDFDLTRNAVTKLPSSTVAAATAIFEDLALAADFFVPTSEELHSVVETITQPQVKVTDAPAPVEDRTLVYLVSDLNQGCLDLEPVVYEYDRHRNKRVVPASAVSAQNGKGLIECYPLPSAAVEEYGKFFGRMKGSSHRELFANTTDMLYLKAALLAASEEEEQP